MAYYIILFLCTIIVGLCYKIHLLTLQKEHLERKNALLQDGKPKKKELPGPFYEFCDFNVGDLVSTKPGVCPGGRYRHPIEEMGPMLLWGEMRIAIRVMGMPYLPEELILEEKKTQ